MINVTLTGAAGQIAYAFLFLAQARKLFGNDVRWRLLDVPSQMQRLHGLVMELRDIGVSDEMVCSSNLHEAFEDADWAIMLGGIPRTPGMQRSDLLARHADVFWEQGEALGKWAKPSVQALVVSNPCHNNARILSAASKLAAWQTTSLALLDEQRARTLLAEHLKVKPEQLHDVWVWGNHSETMVADPWHAKILGQAVSLEADWVYQTWIPQVQKRGSEVLAARSASSAASAAWAIVEHLKLMQQENSRIFSVGCQSQGAYGFPSDLWISVPARKQNHRLEVMRDCLLPSPMQKLIDLSVQELCHERDQAFGSL